MKHLLTPILALSVLFGLSSCNFLKSDNNTISGKQGDVLVVINKDYWDSSLGQVIRDSLTSEYPMLPQVEPYFNLSYVTHQGFSTIFQTHRNILNVDINSKNPNTVNYRKNIWAKPQCIVDLKAKSYDDAITLFKENASDIIKVIENSERDRIISNNIEYPSSDIENKTEKLFGGSPNIPKGAKIFKQTDDFMWIATCNTDFIKQYIFIYKYPVENGKNMMSRESIIKNNEKATLNIPVGQDNAYMTYSKYIEPSLEYIKYNNKDVAEMRGLWEVGNDYYMGGPFICHTLQSPDGEYMIQIEGFVYAPKYDKIQYMREVEAIVYSFNWAQSAN